ncbi:MAG: hypothetical protein WA659_06730 [Candidatus Aquirickettsiella sp.]
MPIKPKNISSTVQLSDPLQKHLTNYLSPFKKQTDYAERKLQAACQASNLIKKNTEISEKNTKKSKHLDPFQSLEAKDKLTVLQVVTKNNSQINQEEQQTIKEYLSDIDILRKENQLVYGKSLYGPNLNCLGLGLIENQDKPQEVVYKKKFISTHTYVYCGEQYTIYGVVEFGVTFDNKIFIVPKSEGPMVNNLYKMSQGTLLKAVGCLQIDNRQIEERAIEGDSSPRVLEGQVKYISVYNESFDAPIDNIAVSLFALQRLGIDLSVAKVVIPNDIASLINSDCAITIHGEIKNAEYYLNETRFPGAKALAEKNLTFFDKIDEVFCSIDDLIFEKRNKKFLEKIYGEKELLKLNLIKLFICTEEDINETEKKTKKTKPITQAIDQPSTSFQSIVEQNNLDSNNSEETTVSLSTYWLAIKEGIEFLKEKNIDLNFLFHEINILLAYILQNPLTSVERDQLKELTIPARLPGRGLEMENFSEYIKFYEQDPVKTCIALLKDYSKGNGWQGIFYRFFSGAWNRNYKDPVNKFLSAYHKNELPDNLNICGIYEKLKDFGLIFNFDAKNKSSLRKILLFFAKLNNEEEALLHLILHASLTLFPPLEPDQDSCINKCC